MADRTDIVKRLSGGASNSDPNASLGGVMSSNGIASQSAAYDGGGISGATLVEALGHLTEGSGTLDYVNGSTSLQWTPPAGSGSQGVAVDVSTDGRYLIPAAPDIEYLVVDVVSASLPGSDTSDGVTVTNELENLFDDTGAVEAALGRVEYRCFYILNDAVSGDALNVRVWITQQPANSPTVLALGLDPAGIGDGSSTGVATTIGDEETAPGGVSFSTPVTEGTALMIGNLQPGEAQAVWVRRTVPQNTILGGPDDPSEITFGVSF